MHETTREIAPADHPLGRHAGARCRAALGEDMVRARLVAVRDLGEQRPPQVPRADDRGEPPPLPGQTSNIASPRVDR
jgi:hypothetical protein